MPRPVYLWEGAMSCCLQRNLSRSSFPRSLCIQPRPPKPLFSQGLGVKRHTKDSDLVPACKELTWHPSPALQPQAWALAGAWWTQVPASATCSHSGIAQPSGLCPLRPALSTGLGTAVSQPGAPEPSLGTLQPRAPPAIEVSCVLAGRVAWRDQRVQGHIPALRRGPQGGSQPGDLPSPCPTGSHIQQLLGLL